LEDKDMLARIRKAQEESEGGFTLIELLVVMIIIGILAAIAIPVFLNQRKKAVDTAAKSDVSTIGKEIATYYVDGTSDPTIAASGTRYTLTPGGDIGKQSAGVSNPVLTFVTTTPATPHSQGWCVTVDVTGGTLSNVYYSAQNGLSTTSC
jgi:type IV pilus assembly protein PilA